MVTEGQIQATRANATGPTIPAGRRISSQDAVLHSLVSGAVVLKGESRRRFTPKQPGHGHDCRPLKDNFQGEPNFSSEPETDAAFK
jgi:hypothetical protein